MGKGGSLPARRRPVLYSCCMSPSPSEDWARFEPGAACGSTLMRAHFTAHSFERHSHETYSVGLTTSGVQTFQCNGALHASLPGDLILFNPDQAHDGQKGAPEGFGYAMLYVPTQAIDDLRDRQAGIDFVPYFGQSVVRDAAVAQAFARTVGSVGQAGESLRADELMRGLLTNLLMRQGERRTDARPLSASAQRMARVRDCLQANYAQDIGIDELAAQAGVSRAHLTRAFSRQFGVLPHVYLNAVRLHRAREAMRPGRSLADVAAACGFADQSHFTRRFKGAMGLTPAQWMRQMSAAR